MNPTSAPSSPRSRGRFVTAFAGGLLLLAVVLSFVPGMNLGGSVRAAGPACTVSSQLNLAQNAYTVQLKVTNTSTTTITGWVLQFTFSGDQRITTGWNASYTQTGAQVTATNVSYDGTIAPNGSVYPGIYGTWSVWNNGPFLPTSFTLNGQSCSIVAA